MITDYFTEEGRRVTAESLSRVEVCVLDMKEAGFKDHEIATALGAKLMERLVVAFPDKGHREIWVKSLLSYPW